MTILPKNIKLWIQEGPGTMLYFSYPGYAATVETKKQHDFWYEFALLLVKDGMFFWACDENDMLRIARLYKGHHEKDKNYTKKLMQNWKKRVEAFYDFCKEIDKHDLSDVSDNKLLELLENFTKLYLAEYAIPILTDSISLFCEGEIQKLLKQELSKKGLAEEYNNYLTKLTQPVDLSFICEEKNELLQIALGLANGKYLASGKEINQKLENHAKKWFWVHNNYARAIVLDTEYFLKRVEEHAKEGLDIKRKIDNFQKQYEHAKKEKLKIIEKAGLCEDLKSLIQLSDEHVYWQDMRKKANLIADHYLEFFVKEISNRKKIDVEDLKATNAYELIGLLKGKKIDRDKLKQRKKMCCMIFTPEKSLLFDYEKAAMIDREIKEKYSINDVKDLYGTVANMGKITAKARLVSGPKDFDKLKQGEILITSMTRPEFIPIMRRAAGVVTDEGGLTCHAAIVSREFNIPCIVGTKIAMKVFKDGDLVELNANHGVVRKIK